MAVGAQGIAEDMGVAAVVLGAGDGETIAKAVELLGVDTVNGETPLQQGIDDRPMRDLDGDGNPLRHTATLFRQPRAQLGQPFPAVGERPFNDDDAVTIKKANLVPLGRPVNASKPIKVHRLSPLLPRTAATPNIPCTGARRRNSPPAVRRGRPSGARVPPQVLETQGAMGRSRKARPIRKNDTIRSSADRILWITLRVTHKTTTTSTFYVRVVNLNGTGRGPVPRVFEQTVTIDI